MSRTPVINAVDALSNPRGQPCHPSRVTQRAPLWSGAFRGKCRVLLVVSLTSGVIGGTLGCRLEAPLAPTPSPSAALVTLFVACGRWTPEGASCTAHGVYSDRGERDLTSESQWESSDASVARVIAGRVTFLAAGELIVRASHQSFTSSARLSTIRAGQPRTDSAAWIPGPLSRVLESNRATARPRDHRRVIDVQRLGAPSPGSRGAVYRLRTARKRRRLVPADVCDLRLLCAGR